MTECQICGRNEEELKEIGHDPEFKEENGIRKCSKCINEYNRESEDSESEETPEALEGDWKEELGLKA